MAKQSGLGDNFYVGGYDLSLDVASVDQMSGPLNTLNVTGIKQSANARLGGLRDGDWRFTSFMDITVGTPPYWVDNLHTLPRGDQIGTYFRGTSLQSPSASINGKQVNYDWTRDTTGNLTGKTEIQANSFGMEWGEQLTSGLRTDAVATTGPAVTDPAGPVYPTNFGAQAYLQLVAFTGTSVDVQITHSATVGGTYNTLIDFGAQSAVGAWRATTALLTTPVQQFLKVNTVGTFTLATFAVCFVRNLVAVQF